MQLVIAPRQVAAVADVRRGRTHRDAGAQPSRDARAQGSGARQIVDEPDLDAIHIRWIRRMSEGRTTGFTAILDVDAEDNVLFLRAGFQGDLAHTGDGNRVGVGPSRFGSADSIVGVAEGVIHLRRQAVAGQARAAQTVEDAVCMEALPPATGRVTNVLPLAADIRAAAGDVDVPGG